MIDTTMFMMIVVVAVVLLLVGIGIMTMLSSQATDPLQGIVNFFNALLKRGF